MALNRVFYALHDRLVLFRDEEGAPSKTSIVIGEQTGSVLQKCGLEGRAV